jgi:type IV pilus assembly protein PilB
MLEVALPLDLSLPGPDDSPAVKLLHALFQEAHRMGASDIHLEPLAHELQVRLRIDGHLHPYAVPHLSVKELWVTRLKVLAGLDIAERRRPQDGHLQWQGPAGELHALRVNTLPTRHGEKMVLRWLGSADQARTLADLGFAPADLLLLKSALRHPHGLILVTGPTGAGKTVTLYSCLHALNPRLLNICTVEDPVEMDLPGINQVQVNEAAGLGFPEVLRALLRQDPDVLMIGEIRDESSAALALRAAQTGHLVLTTLHTPDAPSAILRLRQLGLPALHLAHSLRLITAQRLLRCLCSHCQGQGCAACHEGYKGRVGIHQVMPITCALQKLILENPSAFRLDQVAQGEGMRSLHELGLWQVRNGLTNLCEVHAVAPP